MIIIKKIKSDAVESIAYNNMMETSLSLPARQSKTILRLCKALESCLQATGKMDVITGADLEDKIEKILEGKE